MNISEAASLGARARNELYGNPGHLGGRPRIRGFGPRWLTHPKDDMRPLPHRAPSLLKTCHVCGVAWLDLSPLPRMLCSDACRQRSTKECMQRRKKRRRLSLGLDFEAGINPDSVGERDGWMCWVCTTPVDQAAPRGRRGGASVDHIVAVDDGGSHTWDNVKLAHQECNTARYWTTRRRGTGVGVRPLPNLQPH